MEFLSRCANELNRHTTFSTVVSKHYRSESPKNNVQIRNRSLYLTGAVIAAAETVAFMALSILTAPVYLANVSPKRKDFVGTLMRIADASTDNLLINAFATGLLLAGALVHPNKAHDLSPSWTKCLKSMVMKPFELLIPPAQVAPPKGALKPELKKEEANIQAQANANPKESELKVKKTTPDSHSSNAGSSETVPPAQSPNMDVSMQEINIDHENDEPTASTQMDETTPMSLTPLEDHLTDEERMRVQAQTFTTPQPLSESDAMSRSVLGLYAMYFTQKG